MKYFTEQELECQHCGERKIDPDFMAIIEDMREELGFPFVVTSGYRCKDHPIEARKREPGSHSTGLAIDINVFGENAFKLTQLEITSGIKRIGWNQKGEHNKRFVHLDIAESSGLPSPTIWTY